MQVKLLIPGDPKPMMRPRMMLNKKTGKPFLFIPQPCLQYQQLVRTAAVQPCNLPTIQAVRKSDPYERVVVTVDLTFRNHRHPDPVNVLANVADGLGRATGDAAQVADKMFVTRVGKLDIDTTLEEGFAGRQQIKEAGLE